MLGQRPGLFVWSCAVCAVCGVVLIQQPHLADGNLATIGALTASFTSSLAMIGLHRVKGLDARAIVWHFSGVSLIFAGCAMWLLDGQLPDKPMPVTLASWLFLLGVGTSATLGQFCLTKAFTLGVPSRVSVVGLTQVGFALLFEVLFESRQYSTSSLLGMLLVVAPTAWLLVRRRGASPDETASLSEAG